MLAYLDSNVFDFVAKSGSLKSVASILKQRRIVVLASEFHLLETIAIRDRFTRQSQLKAITTLTSKYNDLPLAWQHAHEVRLEVARCRPEWINERPQEREITRFLRSHKGNWRLAQSGELPLDNASEYHNASEMGIWANRDLQKHIRSEQVTAKRPKTLKFRWNNVEPFVEFKLSDPEDFWRSECAGAWFEAIYIGHPASRDYADYLSPYIRDVAFADQTYASLWKNEINSKAVRLNRITGLCNFFQLQSKIGHGNSYDALHANFGCFVDCFLTCDKGFFNVLRSLKEHLGDDFASPIFIDRSATNVRLVFENALHSIDRGTSHASPTVT